MERPNACTNKFFKDFGVATQEEYALWSSKTADEQQERAEFLSGLDKTQLPLGPYPLNSKEHGWIKFSFDDPDWHVCFRARKDFKLGLQFLKSPCVGIDGRGIASQCKSIEVRLMQEQFDAENNCFTTGNTWRAKLSGKCKTCCLFVC